MKQLPTGMQNQEANLAKATANTNRLTSLSDDRQKHRLPHIPDHQRLTFLRAWHGQPSRMTAIKAKCLDCSGYQRTEVTHCPATACPLWRYRPYQSDPESSATP